MMIHQLSCFHNESYSLYSLNYFKVLGKVKKNPNCFAVRIFYFTFVITKTNNIMEYTPQSLSTTDIYKITTVDTEYKDVYYFIGFDDSGNPLWSTDGSKAKRFVNARDALDFAKTLEPPFKGMDVYSTTSVHGDHL